MKNINWGANFNLLYARYYSKYTVDGKEYNQTLNEFKYNNIINPNNSISIGNTCSSGVTFSIFKPQITLENKDITIFEGVKGDSGIEYAQIGIFTVTKEESNGEYTKYTAYDKMYKAEKGYFSELTYPGTDKAILEEICTKLGIQLATSITNTHTITDKPQGYTMREMIGYMATLQGGNAAINSDGNLEIKWYKDSGYVLDGHQYYQQGVTFTTSKDFTIRKLTCNNTKSGDSKTSEITAGDGTTGLSFANPFMTQAILDEVYKKIGGFQFRPLTVKFLGDWRLEVGDIITVNKGGVDYKVPIMQITHECDGGLMDTVASIGQSDTENSNIASGPITKQMERYYADLVLINKAVIENADITKANIENLKAHQAYIDQLKANKIETVTADIVNLTASKATINEANIAKLQADYAQIGVLNADVADIKTLMFGSATGKSLTTEFANAVVSVIGNAQIKDAMIDSIAASKITALDLNTTKFKVHSENGMSYWQDNTIIIKDTDRIRVQIGKDANSDYNMYVWDKAGNLMFDALGLTEKGVTRKVVRDEVVKDDANINASKLDIETLFNVINNDSTHTLKSNKIYLDNEKQTLNVIMQAITSGAGKDYTQWGGMMKVASDFITNKLWWTENVDNESIKTKFSTVNQKLDSYEITLSDLYQQTNDNFMVYTVTATPTKDNYPAVDWFIPIYPSDDLFPDDNLTWTYSNDEYAKHHGAIAYNETAQKTWRWVKDDKGNWGWKEVSNTQLAYMLNQNASLKINLNSISTELTQTKKNLTDNYSTTTQMNNAITQAVNAESNSIKSEISTTYVTKNTLTGYSTTEAMNNAITQAITKESNSIKLEVSNNYATKKSLKSYATTASLEAYIKKDPATGELKSAIEAIADTINITARGGLNLSGNRFTLSSTNTSITADGTITSNNIIANYGKIAQWNIANNSINSTTSDSKYWAGMTTPSKGMDWVFATLTNEGSSISENWKEKWYVRADGLMYASNAIITGTGYLTSGKIGDWNIKGYLQADTLANDGYLRRVWISPYQQNSGDNTWIYSIQKGIQAGNNPQKLSPLWTVYGNGNMLTQDLSVYGNLFAIKGLNVGNDGNPQIANFYCNNPNSDTQVATNVRIYNNDTSKNFYSQTEVSLMGSMIAKYSITAMGGFIGTIASDSDRNVKKDIKALEIERTADFIYSLIPSEFRMKDGTSNRLHHGFIAQEVKEKMGDSDWGLFIDKKVNDDNYEIQVSDEKGNIAKELTARYALRYDELIADLVATVQSQNMRIKKLEKQLSN